MSDTKAPVTVATGLIAGEPMAGGRRTAVKRQRVRDSRALGTRSSVAAIRDAPGGTLVCPCDLSLKQPSRRFLLLAPWSPA